MDGRMDRWMDVWKLCRISALYCSHAKLWLDSFVLDHYYVWLDSFNNKTLGRALDPRANGTWLSKLTE